MSNLESKLDSEEVRGLDGECESEASECSESGEASGDEDTAVAVIAAAAAAQYAAMFFVKLPCRTSILTGSAWICELNEGNPSRIFENFRMTSTAFGAFCDELSNAMPPTLHGRVEVQEQAVIFLYCVSKHPTNRDLQERFQRSGETIHRHFYSVLTGLCRMARKYIKLPTEPSSEFAQNPKYAPHFDRCRLAFDGTHIPAYVPAAKAVPFRDRTGRLSQNVFATCTFDMLSAFVLSGWDGSAADSTVLADARRRGFVTPSGLFDLGDAGYALSSQVLTPYRGVRYPLKEWGQANERPRTYKELYNLRHAQARNVIERAFVVLKRRFTVLQRPPEYPIPAQAQIVIACCVLHNLIWQYNDPMDDPDGEVGDDMEGSIEGQGEDGIAAEPSQRSNAATLEAGKRLREQVAIGMWDSYQAHLARRPVNERK